MDDFDLKHKYKICLELEVMNISLGVGGFLWVAFLDALHFIFIERQDHMREMERVWRKARGKGENNEHWLGKASEGLFYMKRQSTIDRGMGLSIVENHGRYDSQPWNNDKQARLIVRGRLTRWSTWRSMVDMTDNTKGTVFTLWLTVNPARSHLGPEKIKNSKKF